MSSISLWKLARQHSTIRYRHLNTISTHNHSINWLRPKSYLFHLRSFSASPPTPASGAPQQPPPPKPIIKEETKFEKALQEAKDDALKAAELNSSSATSPSSLTVTPPKKKPLWDRVKEEAVHYWHGSKLLYSETVISSRLLRKLLKGNQLSRREYRQLRRTTGDLLRLVPFIIILVIPFLEFALPVLLRFFPNMLPSTFESTFQEEEKKKNLLKVRIKMAKFLQETVGEVALSGTSKADAAKEFSEFFSKYRMSGNLAPTEDVVKVARKLEDELTLNNLSRPQLVSMAKFMNLNAFGTDSFLRSIIESRLKELKSDDRMIVNDGVENLTIAELQHACSARGIPTIGVSPARMRSELSQWLALHLEHKIPSSLLLLSSAFQTSSRIGPSDANVLEGKAEALQATISALPQQVVNEAQLEISEREGVATYKQKLDVLKEQEELIADELEQDLAQEAAKRATEEEQMLKKASESVAAPAAEAPPPEVASTPSATTETPVLASKSGPFVDADEVVAKPLTSTVGTLTKDMLQVAPTQSQASATPNVTAAAPAETQPSTTAEDKESELSPAEKKKLVDAIKTMSSDSALSDVKQTLDELKEDRQDFKEDVEEFKQYTNKATPKSSDRLGNQVDKMITKLESELAKYDSQIGTKLNLVKPTVDGQITIGDLEQVLRVIRDHPDDERINKIVKKLDADNDGMVLLDEIVKLDDGTGKDGVGEIRTPEKPTTSSNSVSESPSTPPPPASPSPASSSAAESASSSTSSTKN